MRLEDVQIPLRDVEGYPDIRVREPSLVELSELSTRFEGYDPAGDNESSSEATLWFFDTFVRSPDARPFEDLTVKNVHTMVTSGMMLACIDAVKGKTTGLDEVPQP